MVSATTFSRLVVLAFVLIFVDLPAPSTRSPRKRSKWRSGVDREPVAAAKKEGKVGVFLYQRENIEAAVKVFEKKISRHSSRHREHARSGDRTAPDGGTARREISLGCLSLRADARRLRVLVPGESSGSDQARAAAA